MKTALTFLAGAALGAAALRLLFFKVPLAALAAVLAGLACLAWLVVIVVLPWNVHFQARHLLAEMARSRRSGIAVAEDQAAEAARVARRMLGVSVALHLASAALLAAGAWAYDQPVGWAFAGLFLLSTLFRPGFEYYRFLRRQLGQMLDETRYPRQDVRKLEGDVERLVAGAAEQREALAALRGQVGELGEGSLARDREQQQRIDAVARKFEETIDRLTDNQEIISGIKAFLRLVQAGRPG